MQQLIAILTGDVIRSRTQNPDIWLSVLKEAISSYTDNFDIFRGDSFQAELSLEEALKATFYIKAAMIALKLDVRIGIGIGIKDHDDGAIKTSFGSALTYSGEAFDELKKETICLRSPNKKVDDLCNVILTLAAELCGHWTPNMAETVKAALRNEGMNQIDLAAVLGKKYQSQISTELQKASFIKIQRAIAYCTEALLTL
ncbi:hypothetical protein BC792_11032 [Sphingobacterium allocomposti]|jgi:hypothetical protein|uniref:SatD family protein n=1 Tax=Sphingobacterium allocomposti TaxID=415956 RepID=A0A5S5DJ49_9SPHI|nr:hypothetical protein [Sphingobacterium composti Yoo et al. 2007 non Ten et al. 2007]TYP95705.1 hypothetical protein BC792_11032 [Sphingobacterium composti Yoo et al. 2007 non Ten et al. 2007]HLS96595.1 hypothetical protein [Sphingobacterium sp.]